MFLHCAVLLYVEAGAWHLFFYTLWKAILSTLYTFVMLVLVQYLVFRNPSQR
ncbi:MAG: hypothetical protein HC842_08720 [Cytophagales bacterium]|nr:hypothetical protein [Cytophagales bacterium]